MQNLSEETDPPVSEVVEESPVGEVAERIDQHAQSLSCSVVDFVHRLDLPIWLEPLVSGILLFLFLAIFAFLVFFIIRPFVLKIFERLVKKTATKWDDKVIKFGIARWVSHFLSALLLNTLIPGFFRDTPELATALTIFGRLYLIISGLLVFNALLNGGKYAYETAVDAHKLPTTSLLQILKLVAFLIAVILVVSTVAQKSPLAFLGGLGVFTSVIMLVFKDAILGFAAGIHLTSNDMIRKGDWVEIPDHGADGDVLEVGLTTVKVLNFDKTTTTVPTYALISDSFKNWRTMPESGGRRIKRSICIDVKTVRLCDDAMLEEFRELDLITDYIDSRLKEIREWNKTHGHNQDLNLANGRQLTNIGTFRAYIEAYLRNSPYIHHDGMTLLVRQLATQGDGIPIEVYCFSNEVNWNRYEEIQADIFDHLYAVAAEFGLRVFQNPTDWNSETTVQMYGLHHTVVDADRVEKIKGSKPDRSLDQ